MKHLAKILRPLLRPLAALFGFGPRCGHKDNLLEGSLYGEMPVTCRRRAGHRGLHKHGVCAWTGDTPPGQRAGGPS